MASFDQRLAPHTVIGLDTSIFIYQFKAHPRYLPLTQELLAGVEAGRWTGITSTITILELTVQPWRIGRPGVAHEYEALLVHFPHLTLVDIDREVIRVAAQLRARYDVGTPDALQVASALARQGTVFITNDRRLARLSPEIDILVLEDMLAAPIRE